MKTVDLNVNVSLLGCNADGLAGSYLGLKMEVVCFSETLVSTYESTRRYNPEQHRHLHRCQNPKNDNSY
jgi:hypothetical protein